MARKKLLSAIIIIIIEPRTSSFGDREPAPQFITILPGIRDTLKREFFPLFS
jgi:hypothetical protein